MPPRLLPRNLQAALLLALALAPAPALLSAALAPAASARVLEISITNRAPLAGGAPFASSRRPEGIAYEALIGRVRYGFDPESEANTRVTDLALAPRGESGLVEAEGDFVVLQPISPEDRRGTALVDVPNRGRRLALALFNRLARGFGDSAVLDPGAVDWGDGFLMDEGLTLLWIGWQHDAPSFPGALRLDVPRARGADGAPIEGLARSDWVVDEPTQRLSLATLGHVPIPAARPDDPRNALTRRLGREAGRESVPRGAWRFSEDGGAIEAVGAPFAPGFVYELVYVAEDPPLAGLGLAAYRDFVAFARFDPRAPFPVDRAVAHGLSQSGRFLRHLFYEGFGRDESGHTVFDGAMIQIAGAGRGGFDHRFAHPGRVGNPYENFFYPGDDFPFTGRASRDGEREAGLFDRSLAQGTMPRVFQINTGYEYWGRGASLIHMTPDGTADVAPLENERLYHLAGAPHYSLGFPPAPETEVRPGLYAGSRVDTSGLQRALLLRMLAWVEHDVTPPPSRIPTIAGGGLIPPEVLAYPIEDLQKPRSPHVAYHMDYGPDWSRGIVREPPVRGPAYPIRVPAVDALGNEATGIRPLELAVPVGTYLPWALRHGRPGGADEMVGYIGSFLPLAPTEANRRPADARPALDARYPSRDAYEEQVTAAIDALVEAGFLLPRDRRHAFEAAIERWTWATGRDL
jgi:hypothetical protein